MSSMVAFAVLAACALNASAADLYVSIDDPNAADDSAEGRGSEALPYKSIQAAVDAAETDDTVHVKPGVYTNVTTAVDGWGATRVVLNRRIRLESTGGKDVTAIEGVYDPSSSWGTCETAVRAVCVGAAAEGSVVKGFTLRNAATRSARGDVGCGGGLLALAQAYLVDSVVSNCYACESGAALYGGTAIRCLVRGNVNKGESTWAKGTLDHANLWYSVVVQDTPLGYGSYINCTNVNSSYFETGWRKDTAGVYYNCIKSNFGSTYSGDAPVSVDTLEQKDVCISPIVDGDFEPIEGAEDFGIGRTSHVRSVFTVPEEFAATDYAGNAIGYSSESCFVGAIGTTAQRAGGVLVVNSGDIVDGVKVSSTLSVYSRFWPRTYTITVDTNKTEDVACLSRDYGSMPGVPLPDGRTYKLIPPREADKKVNAWWGNGAVIWVSQTRGSDADGDGTKGNPYATIQKACDAMAKNSYPVIKVEAGDYEGFDATLQSGYFGRVYAVDGPTKTRILGYRAGVRDKRCCIFSAGSNERFVVQGFALTDAVWTDTSVNPALVSGAVTLADCIVSNNVSATMLFGETVNVIRSRIVNNTTDGSLARVSVGGYGFCLFAGNSCGSQILSAEPGGYKINLYNCTFSRNEVPTDEPLFKRNDFVPNNCIFEANGCIYERPEQKAVAPCFYWNQSDPPYSPVNDQVIEADPWLADPANGDYRIVANAPSETAGDWGGTQSQMSGFCSYAQGDVDGNPLSGTVDGKMPLGCYQANLPNGFYVACESGELALTGAHPGVNVIGSDAGQAVGISAGPSATRAITGIVVTDASGAVTTNLFADCPQGVWQRTVAPSETGLQISVLYGNDYYVDAVNGSDANNGFTPQSAKKTLAAIAALAVHEGDVIHAAPGVYDEGRMMGPDHKLTYSRVVLPAGVTLVADEGPEVTVIEGAYAPDEIAQKAQHAHDGCGTNATRCVYMNADCRLERFTLRKGRGLDHWTSAVGLEYSGAGVYVHAAGRGNARVVDCVITDCRTGTGAGSCGANCYRCTFTSNGRSAGNVISYSKLYNCLVDGSYQGNAVADGCTIYGSTLRCHSGYMCIQEPSITCYNSVLIGATKQTAHYYGCVMASNSTWNAWSDSTYFHPENCVNCIHTNIASLAWDADLKPTVATSPLVDAGCNEYLPAEDDDTKDDLLGAPRVMNYRPDAGAYEWDVRPEMKATLGRRIQSVGWVTSNAVVNAEGRVLLDGDGARVEAVFKAKSGSAATSVVFPVTITGAGVLTVSVDGVPAAELSASGELRLADVSDGAKLVFSFAGEGAAELGRIGIDSGLLILLR